jgi:hypothetical protein
MKYRSLVLLAGIGLASCALAKSTPEFRADYKPAIQASQFRAVVDNPWFPLVPGTRYVYSERHGQEVFQNEVTILPDQKTVMGVPCVVVHDKLMQGTTTIEDTYDWYSQDAQGNVWYFGEDTSEFDDKGHVSKEGSWEAGVKGAQPGIMMQADPKPGKPYRTEFLKGEAEDVAQVIGQTESVTVPAGRYAPSLETKEWSLLEVGSEKKWYARGVGFIRSTAEDGEVVELVSVEKLP